MKLKNKYKKIASEYDSWAKSYEKDALDKFKYVTPWRMAKKFLPLVKKGQTILELGCGTGLNSVFYHKKGCKLVGVDLSRESLKEAAKKGTYESLRFGNIEDRLRFDDKQFDAVLCISVLSHIKNPSPIIKEMQRIVKPKGYIAFTASPTPAYECYDHTLGEIRTYLKENNLRIQDLFKFRSHFALPAEGSSIPCVPIFYWGIICQKLK